MGIRGPAREAPTVFCDNCGAEIEACEGEHGAWMHSATRREACACTVVCDRQHYAEPQLPERLKG